MSDSSIVRALLGDLHPRDFVKRYWNASLPLHISGDSERFNQIFTLTDVRDAYASPFCETRIGFPSSCDVENPLFPQGSVRNTGWGTTPVPRRSLNRLFQAGGTIDLIALEKFHRPSIRVVNALFDELCYPGVVRVEILISAPNTGFHAYHIDPLASFTIQLEGEKTWDVEMAPAIEWPLHNAQLDAKGAPHYHLREDAPADWERLRTVDESNIETFTLKAGSLLYVPPGHWHRVLSGNSTSISVLFYFQDSQELTTRPHKRALYADPEFRRMPIGWHEDATGAIHPDVVRYYRYRLEKIASLL